METKPLTIAHIATQKLKSGILGSVILYTERATKLINEYIDEPQFGYCSKCDESPYKKALQKGRNEYRTLHASAEVLIRKPR